MEENIVKIKRFISACDELIAGSYRDAEEKISEVLKCLAASEDLTGLSSAVTEEFDYAASKSYYLRGTRPAAGMTARTETKATHRAVKQIRARTFRQFT